MLELQFWQYVILCILAAIGVVCLLLLIWAFIDDHPTLWNKGVDLSHDTSKIYPNYTVSRQEDSYRYLDNQMRGTMWSPDILGNHMEPTLKGRVDMIEDHLGIKVEVKPAQNAKLVIRKVKK